VSMVGQTEQQLTADRVPYEVGMCSFREIARGHISGDETGLLKLLFHRETRRLLGVHIIGDTATEIIHIGQTVISLGGTIDYFRDAVFNYPTMTEAYKVAAFNGLNKLGHELAEGEVDPSDTAPEANALEEVSALRELCVAAGT
jgi:NAD(P) transhydrogenase